VVSHRDADRVDGLRARAGDDRTVSQRSQTREAAGMDDSELDEVVSEFITESHENLDQLDQALVHLEQNPDINVIAGIFRTIHTIKGTSGFLGFSTLERVTHVGENLLSKLREGELAVTTDITTALLSLVDAVREILSSVADDGTEGTNTYPDLVERLTKLNEVKRAVETAAPVEPVASPPAALSIVKPQRASRKRSNAATPVVVEPVVDDVKFGETLMREGKLTEEQLTSALLRQDEGDVRRVGEILVEEQAISPKEVTETLKAQGDDRHPVNETIRVDVSLLDDLMNLVGELVLTRNQILQFTPSKADASFNATSQRLNLITTELQTGVMKTRMQPIENVWSKFPRVVRDLTVGCGKQARLEMEGKHTELDKTLLEAIKDPLTHLVRNSVDHGLEPPAARLAKGKPAEGVVRLAAYHEGGQVIIEISDDGAGIDASVLRRKAVQKGLMTTEEAAARSDRDMLHVIFQAGFSTAEQVSNISGRGVGMDVVKTNIESIGGSVDVHTVVGKGTTFKVKIPLTLAIIPAIVVTVGDDRYAIPQVSLLELVRLDDANGGRSGAGIEWIDGAPVHRLRGRLLPLVFLDSVFAEQRGDVRSEQRWADSRDAFNIVVVQADDHQFGLVVEEISDTAEIVVKPLGRMLKNVEAFAGATIMGDGRVALILDVMGIANHVGITSRERGGSRVANTSDATLVDGDERRRLLLFSLADRRVGLPLDLVARLEEFPASHIEIAGHRPVVQYREEIMHLVDLAEQLGIFVDRSEATTRQVVVYNHSGVSVGLVVDNIFDIIEEAFELDERTATHGIEGTAVLQGLVTDIVDVEAILDIALPGIITERREVAA
jgi:two-component system chemotaxis sensor kinase CheA